MGFAPELYTRVVIAKNPGFPLLGFDTIYEVVVAILFVVATGYVVVYAQSSVSRTHVL